MSSSPVAPLDHTVRSANFVFTLVALKFIFRAHTLEQPCSWHLCRRIDIVGRRRIKLYSAPGMIVGLTLAAAAFHCTCSHSHLDLCSRITLLFSHDRTHGKHARHGCTLLTNLVCHRAAIDDHLRRVVCERIGEHALVAG